MRRAALVLTLLLPLLLGIRPFQGPIQLRVEGFLGGGPDVRPWEMLDVMIGTGPVRPFAMTNIIVLSVGPVMGADILQQVEPIHPNFIFDGDPKLLQEISSALPNQYLKITGYLAFSPQRILVETVEKTPPITGPTATPSLREKLLGF
ncbi:MAG TPA: hypothetical protein VFD92_24695 [Candidatus Binatia bacterium]|nr:hypothetical protein [Candidatus Binatia bacterium]